ncbi:MAG: hypothetical protein Q4G33_09485 [bacterium]|nr:hypothetical protein [bacterium]
MEEKSAVKRLLWKYKKKYIHLAALSVTAVVLFSLCEIMQADFLKTILRQ